VASYFNYDVVELHKIGLFYFPKFNQSDMVEIMSFTHTFTHKNFKVSIVGLLQMLGVFYQTRYKEGGF
jgi:hypothetical protein